MFLPATQGIGLPDRSVSADRHQIGVEDRSLSTGAKQLEGTVKNFDMAGLQLRIRQVISTGFLSIVLGINVFLQ
jgi:hypothetical protein